jgi:hypothetical protein
LPTYKLKIKNYKLTLSVVAVTSRLIDKFSEDIQIACCKLDLPYEIQRHLVKRSELNTYEIKDQSDLTVVLHRNEGRLLLTDKNGIYDAIIRKEFQAKSKLH